HSPSIKVWDTQTGKLVRDLVLDKSLLAAFTPDGRHLIATRKEEYIFYDVPSWHAGRRIRRDVPGYLVQVAFSPDARLIALAVEPGVVAVQELASGRTVLRLEDPLGDRATWIGFAPDGTKLALVAAYDHCVHLWDLRLLRQEL